MKTTETTELKADPVITEVRRAKVAVAQSYGFDVVAMVRGLREREEREAANPPVNRAMDTVLREE